MSVTSDGATLVLVEENLPPSNPRGITSEFIEWSREQTGFLLPEKYRGAGSWKIVVAGVVLGIGAIILLRRKG